MSLAAAVATAGFAASTGKVPRLVFPVVGEASFENDFGDPRAQGSHEGIDILADRKAVAVAAEAGKVKLWTQANAGCMLYLYGRSGTTYLYVHLNNDRGAGNDNRGKCVAGTAFAPGLKSGAYVEAGEPVGFVGDSGDANGIHPHLHFEVHPSGGAATNPFRRLRHALRLFFPASPTETVTLTLSGTVVEAASDRFSVKVTSLRVFPAGGEAATVTRPLTLGLPATAQIDDGGAISEPGPDTAATLSGKDVVVLTEPVLATLAAASGQPGALSASRVVLGVTSAGGP